MDDLTPNTMLSRQGAIDFSLHAKGNASGRRGGGALGRLLQGHIFTPATCARSVRTQGDSPSSYYNSRACLRSMEIRLLKLDRAVL